VGVASERDLWAWDVDMACGRGTWSQWDIKLPIAQKQKMISKIF